MSFWENVAIELEYKKLSKKDFAEKANLTLDTVMKGISRQSVPLADTAIRIAKVLDVSVEYLMCEDEFKDFKSKQDNSTREIQEIRLYRKYSMLISELESLSEKQKKLS